MKFQNFKRLAMSAALTVAIGGPLTVSVPRALADDHGDCEKRVERAEAKFDEAVRKHGENSHEAADSNRALNAERERCWSKYHGWWSGKDHQWHTEHDWDDHDHDHDHR